MSTVTRIILINKDFIRLQNLSKSLQKELHGNGYEVVPDGFGFPCIKFESVNGGIAENQYLIELISFLAQAGAAFAQDHTQTFDPAYTIKYLNEKVGKIKGAKICAYNGKEWVYNEA